MKQNFYSLRIVALTVMMSICTLSVFAQTVKKHVVQRGETLVSIAQKYSVSKDDIIKANPDAAQFVYVGMELTIPETTSHSSLPSNETATDITDIKYEKKENNPSQAQTFTSSSFKRFHTRIMVGPALNNWVGKDVKSGSVESNGVTITHDDGYLLGLNVGIFEDYSISNLLFAGIGLKFSQKGYKTNINETTGQYWNDNYNLDAKSKVKMTTSNIDIPLYVGAYLNSGDTRCYVKGGGFLTYAFSGKETKKGFRTEYSDIHSSETEHINKSTKLGKGELKEFKKFGYGVFGTLGVQINQKFYIEASYERGLSKLIKDSKQYNQSFSLSIGYEIL